MDAEPAAEPRLERVDDRPAAGHGMEEARDAEGDRGSAEDEPPGVHQYQSPATAATNVITLM